jgi:hypothetical protein
MSSEPVFEYFSSLRKTRRHCSRVDVSHVVIAGGVWIDCPFHNSAHGA